MASKLYPAPKPETEQTTKKELKRQLNGGELVASNIKIISITWDDAQKGWLVEYEVLP